MPAKKSKTIQESFPEICDVVTKHGTIQNAEVKARFAKKTGTHNNETFQLCQVYQDSRCPENVIIIKETLIKCEIESDETSLAKIPPIPECPKEASRKSSDSALHKSESYIYCKEVVKPYLDPKGKSAAELACEAVDAASKQFPKFKYCCSVDRSSPPLVVNSEVIKNPSKEEYNKPAADKACKDSPGGSLKDTANCVVGLFCGATKAAASKAQSCMKDVCSILKRKDSDDDEDRKRKKKDR